MNELRNRIVNEIDLLANLDSQIKYEEEVGIVHIPSELVCVWFDDLYHPETELFNESLKKSEKSVLADFNTRFDELLKKTDKHVLSETIEDLQKDKYWQSVVTLAQNVIEKLNDCK